MKIEPSLLDPDTEKRVVSYWELLKEGNRVQNLSRKSDTWDEFVQNHLIDCIELRKSGWLKEDSPRVDLGSGCGVPGLLAAAIEGPSSVSRWWLLESEKKKAEFLSVTARTLGLSHRVAVVPVRIEDWLPKARTEQVTIVSRAVGKVDQIMGWISKCSTWNRLVLFKSKGWQAEWAETSAANKKKLKIYGQIDYSIQDSGESKFRTLICLDRVPRGTSE